MRGPVRPGQWLPRRKLDGPACQANQRIVVAKFDHTETGVLGAAIYAQHAHGEEFISLSKEACWHSTFVKCNQQHLGRRAFVTSYSRRKEA